LILKTAASGGKFGEEDLIDVSLTEGETEKVAHTFMMMFDFYHRKWVKENKGKTTRREWV